MKSTLSKRDERHLEKLCKEEKFFQLALEIARGGELREPHPELPFEMPRKSVLVVLGEFRLRILTAGALRPESIALLLESSGVTSRALSIWGGSGIKGRGILEALLRREDFKRWLIATEI